MTKSGEAARDSLFLIRDSTQKGFTLVEMIVSIALFSFVMLATTTVLLSVVDANHKAQGLKTAMNNLSLTLESMARNLRTGSDYQCGGVGRSDCSGSPSNVIAFKDQTGDTVTYCFYDGAIRIAKQGIACGAASDPMTAPEIVIDRLDFYVDGVSATNQQPRVLIVAGGAVSSLTAAGAKARTASRFDIQTFVSQRVPDVR